MILTKDLSELRNSEWARELAQIHSMDMVEDILLAVATKPVSVEVTRDIFEGEYKWSVEPSIFDMEGLPLAIYLFRETYEECKEFCDRMGWSISDVTDHTMTLNKRVDIENRVINYWMTKLRIASDTTQVPEIFHGSGRMHENVRKRVLAFLNNPCEGTWAYIAGVKMIAGQVSATDVMTGTREKPFSNDKRIKKISAPERDEFLQKLKEARANYIDMCKKEIATHERQRDWLQRRLSKNPSETIEARNCEPQILTFPTRTNQEN